MSQELITIEQDRFMPVLSLQQAIDRRKLLVDLTRTLMVQDVDYGIIPGTPKPTLLKPGAEKLCTQFGMTPTFELVDSVKDWNGATHGEPLFYFEYKCRLWRGDMQVGEGNGSCNSWEKKYRYRDQQRVCPSCGVAAIFKSKPRQGDPPGKAMGWYCWSKKGGCGAQFGPGDTAIESQETGQIANPDVFDQINTITKMSQKRALIAATLVATNASEFYTQDLDELPQPAVAPVEASFTAPALDTLRTELKRARERLSTLGGTPRPLSKQQAMEMDGAALADEILNTSNVAWELAIAEIATARSQAQAKAQAEADELFPEKMPASRNGKMKEAELPL